MKMIVEKDFVLTRDSGELVQFLKGETDMSDADATHWYTRVFATPSESEAVKKAAKGK